MPVYVAIMHSYIHYQTFFFFKCNGYITYAGINEKLHTKPMRFPSDAILISHQAIYS